MDAAAALAELRQPQTLSILTLAEPYVNPEQDGRTGGHAGESRTDVDPTILAADLAHYRELFSKLRFSYVEQVTKERFLRAITAEQPEFVEAGENAALEEQLKGDKAALKARKVEVRELLDELEEQGRQLARRYEGIQTQTAQLDALPAEITGLEESIRALRQSQAPKSDKPELSMPLEPTLALVAEREEELAEMDRQIAALRSAIPAQQAQLSAVRDEVTALQARKIKVVGEALEARRRKEGGGLGDDLDERGRWLRAVETSMRTMLEV